VSGVFLADRVFNEDLQKSDQHIAAFYPNKQSAAYFPNLSDSCDSAISDLHWMHEHIHGAVVYFKNHVVRFKSVPVHHVPVIFSSQRHFFIGRDAFTLTLQLIAASFFKSANTTLRSWQENKAIAETFVEKLRLGVRSVFDAVELIEEIVQSSYVCLLSATNINIQLSLFSGLQVLYDHILGLETQDTTLSVMLLRDVVFIILQFMVPHFLELEVN
jgi:hypothetical protein